MESEAKPDTSIKDDPSLDITSDKFDPLRALYSNTIPSTKAKVFDNLSTIESIIKRIGSVEVKFDLNKKQTSAKNEKQQNEIKEDLTIIRKFLPHQQMIKGPGRSKRTQKNVLTSMTEYSGALGQLKIYMENRQRIHILIRKSKGIRGYITGYLEAFDKHWNMALVDVTECWKRRKHKYTTGSKIFGVPQDMSQRLRELEIFIPKISSKNLNRKNIECTRTIPKLFVRGDHIAVVSLVKNIKE